jgi:hypothetical protein
MVWDNPPVSSRAVWCKDIAPFNARGRRKLYCRGDVFGRKALNMDVWLGGEQRLLARFWSNDSDVGSRSLEITGWILPPRDESFDAEAYIPIRLREAYQSWVEGALKD